MAKGKFERTKPHVNVGTIGHVDHGKTTLTAAMTAVLAAKFGGGVEKEHDIDNSPVEEARGSTNNTAKAGNHAATRAQSHLGLTEPHDHNKNNIQGAAQ